MRITCNTVVGVVFILTTDIVAVAKHHILGYYRENPESDREVEDNPIEDHYTFVALIDIVFTDGTKRTCTGPIIHDNVVITLAHCFILKDDDEYIECELSGSFVVIGTKKLFDTGYEQYLPIERIINHPRYKGWIADLALVYTFAGMMSDKPGRIIPLAGKKTFSQFYSNVTVFSWGHCDKDDMSIMNWQEEEPILERQRKTHSMKQRRGKKRRLVTKPLWRVRPNGRTPPILEPYRHNSPKKNNIQLRSHHKSIYANNNHEDQNQIKVTAVPYNDSSSKEDVRSTRSNTDISIYDYFHNKFQKILSTNETKYKKHKWLWSRRKMGFQDNKLSVEVFNMLDSNACKRIIDKAFKSLEDDIGEYNIRTVKNMETDMRKYSHEFICFTSDNHFITKEDDGAAVVHRGHLVGITVSNVEHDGNQVAIALKIPCFCPWIADNLPGAHNNLNCCQECCDKKMKKTSKKDHHLKPSDEYNK